MKGRKGNRTLGLLTGTLLMALIFALNAAALMVTFRPKSYSVSVGDTAEADVLAPMDAVDNAATDVLKQQARDAVEPIMRVNSEKVSSQLDALRVVLESFGGFMVECREVWDENAIILSETQYRNDGDWKTLLPAAKLMELLDKYSLNEYLDAAAAYSILNAYLPMGQMRAPKTDPDIKPFSTALVSAVELRLAAGLNSSELESAANDIRNNLPQSIPLEVRMGLVPNLCAAFLVPTWTEDLPATERARVEAAGKIERVSIKKGQIIVRAGETVTDEQMATLTSLGLLEGERNPTLNNIGMILYTLCLYTALWLYFIFFERDSLKSWRTMLSITLIMLISLGLGAAFAQWETRIVPVMLAPLLMASLHDKRTAMAMNVTVGLGTGVLMGADYGVLFNEQALLWAAVSIIMGQTAIALRERDKRRGGVLLAGLVAGAVGGIVSVSMSLIKGESFVAAFTSFGLVFAGGLIATIITLGLTVLFELMFDIPTDARLNELLNTNHPLLKRMMTAAPGTYHHCMMAAQLAENAAESVGANALLVKVGATYHDVGKLRRPHMFSENQANAANPHDALPAVESARIIIAHQQDAEAVLQKFRMPSAVIKLVREHHGNTLVVYFYNKAQKLQPARKVAEDLFRYPAPRPSSLESAIVMMADSCEAAVRSLNAPSVEEVKAMTHSVIRGKMEDGQFNECDITTQQLARIESSFVSTFQGIMHDRISYSEEKNDRGL